MWWSHKFNGPGLRYEIGICIQTGWIVWVNGPYSAGQWPDLRIGRGSLNQLLEAGERHIADGGYGDRHGPANTPTRRHEYVDRMKAHARARHETVNGRFKSWGILKQQYRHPLVKHGRVMHSIAIITQIVIANGESTWVVVYEDLA